MFVARKGPGSALVAVVCAVGLLTGAGSALAEEAKFTYTGKEQEFKVPAGVTSVNVVAVGSHGESAAGLGGAAGAGAIVTGKLSVKPEQVLYVEVGGVPFNGGGGTRFGGKGGGASDVRTLSIGTEPSPGDEESLLTRLLVAAGGGGGGSENFLAAVGEKPPTCSGGHGGGGEEKGANGTSCGFTGGEGGGAGEANKGGAGGTSYKELTPFSALDGEAGRLGAGGGSEFVGFSGGGGGGRYGGGGGGEQAVDKGFGENAGEGGGGGGSSLVPEGGDVKLAEAGGATSVTFTYTPALPTSKDQCKKGGWKNFGGMFKNQGQCVRFVNTGG
jgi:hypothetical protein